MKIKPYFPMFVDLSDKKIVVVGGGKIATRRVKTLLEFTRNVTVVAPKITPELTELAKTGRIELCLRPVTRSDLTQAYMVLAATNDWKVNDEVYNICKMQGIYVNLCNDKEKCDFYFPGIVKEEELVVGITASGADHSKARRIREEIQKVLKKLAGD